MHWDVIIIGGGPAGLMAGFCAAQRGRRTLLLEKKRRPGTKILLSGGTRCNLTHATDRRGIIAAFGHQGNFLHSALASLGPEELVDLFEAEGVATKTEPGGKVFPRSDRAADVLAALLNRLGRTTCELATEETVVDLRRTDTGFEVVTSRGALRAQNVVLATGGQSYSGSGSTGDGYRFAAALGHAIVTPRPALVPVTTHAEWVRLLSGITLPDIVVRVVELRESDHKAATLAERRGALLFAHFGVTGPAVLDVSRSVSDHPRPASLVLRCDLLPDVKRASLEAELEARCRDCGKRQAASLLDSWLPQRVSEAVARQIALDPERRVAELTRRQRLDLAEAAKGLDIPVAGTMGFRKAEVTAGGVALAEVDSHSMQSRLVPGLYFAGEVLDLDGPIGGYNFQAAFSTGWLAGQGV